MARMFAARQLTAVMLGRMEGLVGNVDLDMFELSAKVLTFVMSGMFSNFVGVWGFLWLPNFFLHFLDFCLHFCNSAFCFS